MEEIVDYAAWLGIKDPEHFCLARQGLLEPLPSNFRICMERGSQRQFYYDIISGESVWEHPLDDKYRRLYWEESSKRGNLAGTAKRELPLFSPYKVTSGPDKVEKSRSHTVQSPSSVSLESTKTRVTGVTGVTGVTVVTGDLVQSKVGGSCWTAALAVTQSEVWVRSVAAAALEAENHARNVPNAVRSSLLDPDRPHRHFYQVVLDSYTGDPNCPAFYSGQVSANGLT